MGRCKQPHRAIQSIRWVIQTGEQDDQAAMLEHATRPNGGGNDIGLREVRRDAL